MHALGESFILLLDILLNLLVDILVDIPVLDNNSIQNYPGEEMQRQEKED